MNWKLWIKGLRPKTLPASVAPVLVGAASAWRGLRQSTVCPDIYPVPRSCITALNIYHDAVSRFAAVLLACAMLALFLQIAVNFANDYSDGIRGTDASRSIDEAEGGKPERLVASGVRPVNVLAAAGVNAAIACIFGMGVVLLSEQYLLLPVGAACLLAAWFYTGGKHPYGYMGLGELFVFLCFGCVATLGTQYALAGRVDLFGGIGALCTGLLSCVMLMVNNLRDVQDDAASGKRTLAVRLGRRRAEMLLFAVLAVPAMILLIAGLLALYANAARLWTVALLSVWCLRFLWSVAGAVRERRFAAALPLSSMALLTYGAAHIAAMLLSV
jgi:1,4-dihydroxy-2-naphthoate octaprenyltransferase